MPVPQLGLDPTPDELSGMATVADARRWSGVTDATFAALQERSGPFTTFRELVMMPAEAWAAAITETRIGTDPADPQANRPLLPVEVGHVGSLRRVARLRMGLPGDEGAPTPSAAAGTGLAPPGGAPANSGAGSASGNVVGGVTQRRVKLANVLDQGDDTEIVPLTSDRVRSLMKEFRKRNDDTDPTDEEEITGDQLAALDAKIQAGQAPYADFGVWRPFGSRIERQMKFVAKILNAQGQWINKELSGPPDFHEWGKSYKVLRTGLITLDVVKDARIRAYFDRMAELNVKFGSKYWWLIAQADIRMRSERMEKIYRTALIDHAEALDSGGSGLKGFDLAKPWDFVWRKAADDDVFWDKEVDKKVMLHATNIVGAKELVSPGTLQIEEGPQIPGAPGTSASSSSGSQQPQGGSPKKKVRNSHIKKGNQGGRNRGGNSTVNLVPNSGKADGKGRQRGNPDEKHADGRFKYAKNGQEICYRENHSAAGCPDGNGCPRLHICEFCRNRGHKSIDCRQKPEGWTPP